MRKAEVKQLKAYLALLDGHGPVNSLAGTWKLPITHAAGSNRRLTVYIMGPYTDNTADMKRGEGAYVVHIEKYEVPIMDIAHTNITDLDEAKKHILNIVTGEDNE